MSSIVTMARRLDRMTERLTRTHPRIWTFCLGEDEDIPEEARAKFGPLDTVYIKRYGGLTAADLRHV